MPQLQTRKQFRESKADVDNPTRSRRDPVRKRRAKSEVEIGSVAEAIGAPHDDNRASVARRVIHRDTDGPVDRFSSAEGLDTIVEFRLFPTGSPRMDKPFDTTLKQMVDQNLPDWARFLGGRLNLPMPLRLSPLDGDVSTVNLQADKLFRLSGSTKAIVHVEFQTARDRGLPLRVMRYSVLANARYDLPVYSVVMLLTRKADFAGMDGEFILKHEDGSEYHRFRYDVIRVWQLPAKSLLDGGTGMMPLVMLTDEVRGDPEPAFHELVVRSKALFPNPGHHREFIAKALILGGLHFNEAIMRALSEKGSRLAGSSMYQIIYKKGKAEGEAAVLHRLILRWASSRFGEADGANRTSLEAIADIPRLERMSDRLTTASTWDDLLATV